MNLHFSAPRLFCQATKQARESIIEQGSKIRVRRPVSMELEKNVRSNAGCKIKPAACARRCWQIIACYLSGLKSRRQAFAKSDAQRSGDHQQVPAPGSPNHRLDAAIIRPWPAVRMARAPVDLVYYAGLGRGRERRHGKVRVTAQFAQQPNLSLQTAPAAIRPRIIERPVSMDKAKCRFAVLLPKQTVIVSQPPTVIGHLGYESITDVMIMMKMNLDVGNPKPHHLGYAIKQIAAVFFLRIEEAVLRALTIGISWRIFRNSGPAIPPESNALHCFLDRSTHSEGFEMVGDRNPGAPWCHRSHGLSKPVPDIRHEPQLGMSG